MATSSNNPFDEPTAPPTGPPPPAVAARVAAEHATPRITVDVVRSEMSSTEKEGDSYARYVIKVSSTADGYNAYHVRRRYRQFDTLNTTLRSAFRGLPSMPGKSTFGSSKDLLAQAESRREGLTAYLRTLLADPA